MDETHDSNFNNYQLNEIYELYREKSSKQLDVCKDMDFDVHRIEEHLFLLKASDIERGYQYKEYALRICWELCDYPINSLIKIQWITQEEAVLTNEGKTKNNWQEKAQLSMKYPYSEMKSFSKFNCEDKEIIFDSFLIFMQKL